MPVSAGRIRSRCLTISPTPSAPGGVVCAPAPDTAVPDISRLDSAQADFKARFTALLTAGPGAEREVWDQVRAIVDDVRARGDAALLEYTRRFDQYEVAHARNLEIPHARLQDAHAGSPDSARGQPRTDRSGAYIPAAPRRHERARRPRSPALDPTPRARRPGLLSAAR